MFGATTLDVERAARTGTSAQLSDWIARARRVAPPVGALLRGVSPRMMATAAIAALAIGAASMIGVSTLSRRTRSVAHTAVDTVTTFFTDGTHGFPKEQTMASVLPLPGGKQERAETPAPAAQDAPAAGLLSVYSRVPLEMFVDGSRIGTTDESRLVIKPGRYRIELANTEFNYHGQIVVTVRPGQVTARTVTLPTGLVHINTDAGAEIWIEGERVGTAPLGPVATPIGTREVIVRHPQFGEHRAAAIVRVGETAEVSVTVGTASGDNPYPLPSLRTPGPPIRGSR